MTLRILALALLTYAFHFAWEMAHARWFANMAELPFWTATAWCARAALSDVAIAAVCYVLAALAAREIWWTRALRRFALLVYFAAGLTITIGVERWALSVGRWRYTSAMPTLSGVGVTPLLQWVIVPALTIAAARVLMRPSAA